MVQYIPPEVHQRYSVTYTRRRWEPSEFIGNKTDRDLLEESEMLFMNEEFAYGLRQKGVRLRKLISRAGDPVEFEHPGRFLMEEDIMAVKSASGASWMPGTMRIQAPGVGGSGTLCSQVLTQALIFGIAPRHPHNWGVNISTDGVWGSMMDGGEVYPCLPMMMNRSRNM